MSSNQPSSASGQASAQLPVAVAVVNDYELVVQGLAAMLARYPDLIEVREVIVYGEPIENGPIEVALFDTYGRSDLHALRELMADRRVRRSILFTLDPSPGYVEEAKRAGATGFVAKSLPADDIVAAIVRVASGETVWARGDKDLDAIDVLDWPGKARGLTQRESQALVLAADGLTNAEIGEAIYLSRETIKSHLASAYRKLRVRSRLEAANLLRTEDSFRQHQRRRDSPDQS